MGLPFSSTTFGCVLGDASCALSSVGVSETSCFSTRSATTTTLSSTPTPSGLSAAFAPNSASAVVTATTREPYVAPSSILVNTSPTSSSFGIDSGEPLS